MISKRQLEANRRNALKAAGPKTPEGKAVACLNSLRHGLAGARAVTSPEDQRLFDDTFAALADDLKPAGPFETLVVYSLTVATLRLDRIRRMETDFYNRHLEKLPKDLNRLDPRLRNALVYLEDVRGTNRLATLSRYEVRAGRSFIRALHELRRLQAARAQVRPEAIFAERTHSQKRTPLPPVGP